MSESVDQILGEFRGFNIGENGAKAALSPGADKVRFTGKCGECGGDLLNEKEWHACKPAVEPGGEEKEKI